MEAQCVNDFSNQNGSCTKKSIKLDTGLHKRVMDLRERLQNCKKYSNDDLRIDGFEYMDDEKIVNKLRTECERTLDFPKNKFSEGKLIQEVRLRSFSHCWKNTKPTKEQMIFAGFFQCNVSDRVICLYCNLIIQQWTEDDDPSHVHKTLSPNCCFVRTLLNSQELSPVCIVNESLTKNSSTNTNTIALSSDSIVHTSAVHSDYATITTREASFETWDTNLLPAVNDLTQAGFFYTGRQTITTCFYCGGSLQNWGKHDKPIIEHIRWFSTCKYAKQLAGDTLYNRIQEIKCVQAAGHRVTTQVENNNVNEYRTMPVRQLEISNERMMSRLVAARLDLPISQRLLDKPFKLSIIKRCWEDQLRLKHDDFATDCDLYIACVILHKQIEHINGNKNNIIIPSIKMKEILENNHTMELKAPSAIEPIIAETNSQQTETKETNRENQIVVNNPCILCWKEEKRLACIPCGHFVACTNCQKIIQTCPVCRRGIEAFVRIYI